MTKWRIREGFRNKLEAAFFFGGGNIVLLLVKNELRLSQGWRWDKGILYGYGEKCVARKNCTEIKVHVGKVSDHPKVFK